MKTSDFPTYYRVRSSFHGFRFGISVFGDTCTLSFLAKY